MRLLTCLLLLICPACSDMANGDGPVRGVDGGLSAADAETLGLAIVAKLEADPRTAQTTHLSPQEYEDIASQIAKVPGVEVVDYSGDNLGTIFIKAAGGGLFVWRHIKADYDEELPPEFDPTIMLDPMAQKDWGAPQTEVASVPYSRRVPPPAPDVPSSTYATQLPYAPNSDPSFARDDVVTCPTEGKVAIVDFAWQDTHDANPWVYDQAYNVDGVMLYDRIHRVFTAAGFTVDEYRDAISIGDFATKLKDYTFVFTFGHGGRPGPRLGHKLNWLPFLVATPNFIYTSEDWNEDAPVDGPTPMTLLEAWNQGYVQRTLPDNKIMWSSLLIRDRYKPAVDQMWYAHQCFGMMPFNTGWNRKVSNPSEWEWVSDVTGVVYNFGHALREVGVKVVFGYSTLATTDSIPQNLMPFIRRQTGGYSIKDPAPTGYDYWPTCMTAQTFFRARSRPFDVKYYPIQRGKSILVMNAVDEGQYFRKVCSLENTHAYLQQFIIGTGDDASFISDCWNEKWSLGVYPSESQDPICGLGDKPTTQESAYNAACGVKIARRATNAILNP